MRAACLWQWPQLPLSLLPPDHPLAPTTESAVSPPPAGLKEPLSWAWRWPSPAFLSLLRAPKSKLLKPPNHPPPGPFPHLLPHPQQTLQNHLALSWFVLWASPLHMTLARQLGSSRRQASKGSSFLLPQESFCSVTKESMALWGTWVAQSAERLASAQVMISRFVSSSPALGSGLTARSLESASYSVSPFFSAPPLLTCYLSLKNK